MHTQPTPSANNNLQYNKVGSLDAFTINGDGFHAVVLKQGAQLIHFSTDADTDLDKADNWLWLSELAEYESGESVRGGVPICWPVFGQFNANPQSVKDSFSTVSAMPQHGYARTQPFELERFSVDNTNQEATQTATLVLRLDHNNIDPTFNSAPNLGLTAIFTFSEKGFGIELITHNNSESTVTFSQALHTYLPTADISKTYIKGFDGTTYSDALTTDPVTGGWQTKTQHGDIEFKGSVDRVYHSAPQIALTTPKYRYQLSATSSDSTVIWSPGQQFAPTISQFAADAYQRMLCIETANAHLDVVTLEAGDSHSLTLKMSRD
ncbi:D-hexose-6-phosphate mutarotase [Psychrobacter sp. FDAARGOS_221]|uniref:D-hexose-6-phosphate mutarotase n=1 Tax=Psychrobacter sp. FDAARGOS_221 TaxID=1975705 RepID=UPI000BB58449|nr:D-hexose-6-phosphate mutarotase [Psychrobacter sp. FDAARGOS_221]PNK60472.1 D-hexose-6-phosphate mutarotase [Psychrobacter sp. FDAARGOS_221]